MDVEEQFKNALSRADAMPVQPPNIQLALYGLFKQATKGDVSGKRPGMLELKKRAKYDAWAMHKGVSASAAMEAYVKKVDELNA